MASARSITRLFLPASLVLLLAAHLALIWSFPYLPAQDAPAHLNNAQAMTRCHDPAHAIYGQYYDVNDNPDPNFATHLLLAVLMNLFPMLTAQKILVSGYIILLPLGAYYAIGAFSRSPGKITLLIFPFICNFLFEKGFYNFCYSLAMFFFALGYYLRHRSNFRADNAGFLAIITVPLYFTHPVSLVMAQLSIGVLAIVAAAVTPGRRAQSLLPIASLLPTASLLGMFVLKEGFHPSHPFGPAILAQLLLSLQALYSFSQYELFIAAGIAASLGATALWLLVRKLRRRQWGKGDDLLLVIAAFVPLYLLTPNVAAGGSWISTRLTLYPYLLLIIWLAAQEIDRRWLAGMQIVAVAASLAIVSLHAVAYRRLSPYIQEYVSVAPCIQRHSTLLPICVSDRGYDSAGKLLSKRVKLFTAASGYLAAERDLIDLSNYEASLDYFPVRFRPEIAPATHLYAEKPREDDPLPRPLILEYPQRTAGQGRIDYVLIWQVREPANSPTTRPLPAIEHDLAQAYDLVYTSPHGFARLYRHR